MNPLEKIASYSTSRLEKIASAVEAIEEGYNPDEVMAFAADNGIHPDEIVMGNNLFEADLEKEASEQELYKLASIIDDPETLPLVKVAAAVDLFAEGGITADDAYAIGETYGFDGSDVDYIFEQSFPELAKEAEDTPPGMMSKLWGGVKDAYAAGNIRRGWKGSDGKKKWGQIARGTAETGAAYGVPAGAAAYGYTKYKKKKEHEKGKR